MVLCFSVPKKRMLHASRGKMNLMPSECEATKAAKPPPAKRGRIASFYFPSKLVFY